MTGETVTVRYRQGTGAKDGFGGEICAYATETVGNVLVEPVAGADLAASNRPDGDMVKYRLHMPKAWAYSPGRPSLRGSDIQVRGQWLPVVGDPDAYEEGNTPTEWCMPVLLQAAKG